jgi:succinate dehydrogenase/fumarate reductase flavoprotein subunit
MLGGDMGNPALLMQHIPGTMGSIDDYEYDLVTLGAGSGGTRASRISAQHYGAKVACVELPFGFIASDKTGGAGGT